MKFLQRGGSYSSEGGGPCGREGKVGRTEGKTHPHILHLKRKKRCASLCVYCRMGGK